MARLSIRHETLYTYERPVRFAAHRLLMRPRDSHATRVVDAHLTLSPPGETHWLYDAMANSVCSFTPDGESRILSIVSELTIERFPAPLLRRDIADPQTVTPIVYAPSDRAVLAPFIDPVSDDADGHLLAWLRNQVGSTREPALDFLLRLNRTIHADFQYIARDTGHAQEPSHTVSVGSGACRDFAWLMVESLRRLGYAARFVTGYLYSPGAGATVRGAGATHAWCEVFLPELGWTEFDPTNALAESPDLIPVAMTRTPVEAAPVSGAIYGDGGQSNLTVHVDVRPAQSLPAAA
ncbi:MAG: transglutaminase domain protein [Phenylobacterium sp.]|jgi:transglutaminase-like putative cysteine protease|uniref:transglutaminase family protein n=1 Tax=Phenylobacterium sp. TaxID=1871053 RepID=UPI0026397BE7|nr:transglutaminase family protein [Phenylobacterium sp.]MDB5498752.1 transglutaminase domain protein [Phenylobacterium sp.]